MQRFTITSLVALSVLLVGSVLPAATISLDLGITGQETSLTSWNDYTGSGTTLPTGPFSLDYSTGIDSGIDLGIATSGSVGFSGGAANWGGPYPAEVSGFPPNSILDSVYVVGGTITATLFNLNPDATYDFLFYGADGNADSQGVATTWTVTGLNSGFDTISATHMNSTEVAFVPGIIPDGSNEIAIAMTSPGIGRWSILQITEIPPPVIPEPSSLLLLGLGGLGLVRYTRRRARRA